jgi:hypothetical protein
LDWYGAFSQIVDAFRISESEGMKPLTIFGLFAVAAMLVCYALERRNRLFILGFAGACVLGSVYGFLQRAWPFGIVEGVWSVVAFRRWWLTRATMAR